ncbi:NUDIX hydrolase [Dyadobacter sp. CY345]|uniref:NUDIX domain-containing protein n=1 Tax=Dyadobacter sp. CY345 TaxID=2909335 RepID=UPI001F1E1C48|nr:NUDIX hydrolase [Dyadobacter sp. CY345]MCF2444208.1 NUDIX hydrolase [Dyadobacter sp. CY345]
MEAGKQALQNLYGNKLRVRVCGICIQDDQILLVRHNFVGSENIFWSPPGGGMEFGESAPAVVAREFFEETGLVVEVGQMLFVNELILPPLHAVEIFFHVEIVSGSLTKGFDPEFSAENQILQEVSYLTMKEVKQLPENHVHNVFQKCKTLEDLLLLQGYMTNQD